MTSPDPHQPVIEYASPRVARLAKPSFLQALACLLLFVVPEAFFRFYQPLNEGWLVKRFGCGCPRISSPGKVVHSLNANDISMIVYGVLALLLCGTSYLILRRTLKQWPLRPRLTAISVVFGVTGFLCMRCFGRGMWL